MVNNVKKLQPTNADVFEKNYPELKETDADVDDDIAENYQSGIIM
jgi:hypothetical protein